LQGGQSRRRGSLLIRYLLFPLTPSTLPLDTYPRRGTFLRPAQRALGTGIGGAAAADRPRRKLKFQHVRHPSAGEGMIMILQEHPMSDEAQSPPDFKVRVEELQALITQKLSELEENAEWGTADEREELAQALDDLTVQVEALRDALDEIVE
jgi:hypothetical protein